MLKTSLIKHAQAYIAKNGASISTKARARKIEGTGQIEGRFLYHTYYNENLKRTVGSETPHPQQGKTKRGGNYYKCTFEFIPSDMTVGDCFSIVKDTDTDQVIGFNVRASVNYSPGKSDGSSVDARAFLKSIASQAHSTERDTTDADENRMLDLARNFVDADGNVAEHVTRFIDKEQVCSATMWTFSDQGLQSLSRTLPGSQVPLISFFTQITLQECSAELYLKAYTFQHMIKDDNGNNIPDPDREPTTRLRFPKVNFKCKDIKSMFSATSNEARANASAILHKMFRKERPLCVPLLDVLNGSATARENAYFWASAVPFEKDGMSRIAHETTEESSFITNKNNPDKLSKLMFSREYVDVYENADGDDKKSPEMYIVLIKAFEEQCRYVGLDPEVWVDLMLAHHIDSHMLVSFYESSTMEKPDNSRAALEQAKDSQVKGYYEYVVKQWIPDWRATLERDGILISKDTFLNDFATANKSLKSNAKYRIVRVGDGKDEVKEIQFISVLPYNNPLNVDPLNAQVLNFGSQTRPVINTPDASPILDRDTSQFYALTSISTAQSQEEYPELKGDTLFKAQKASGATYQLFVVQGDATTVTSPSNEKTKGKKKKTSGRGKKK